jgi:antitoxin component YwqK of YwqJK toxin-antitoxin module
MQIKKVLFFLFVICACNDVFAQFYPKINLDTLNRYNAKKKKDGYWIEMLNAKFLPTDNKNEAVFYRYAIFVAGGRIYPMGTDLSSAATIKMGDSTSTPRKDTIVLLQGKYTLYSKKGKILEEDIYRNGMLLSLKIYYKSGQLSNFIDYVKGDKEHHPHSYTLYNYRKNGQLIEPVYEFWITH